MFVRTPVIFVMYDLTNKSNVIVLSVHSILYLYNKVFFSDIQLPKVSLINNIISCNKMQ